MKLAWVCLGGAIGSGARYLIFTWSIERFGRSFPWGTLAVNVVGCFLLAALVRTGEKTAWIGPGLFLALTTGVMGGFTTYSTFNLEVFAFIERGDWRTAATYVAATLAGAFAAGAAGYAAARAALG